MDKNTVAVNIFNKLATHYQNRFMDVSLYGDTFDFFCSHILKQNPHILELACGPGNITKYLLNKRPDFKLLATDLAPNMVALAKINNPGANCMVMDCMQILTLNKMYDGLMCGFCLPYLAMPQVQQLINHAAQILNPGGLLYLSTMEDDYTKSELKKGSTGDEIFMHFYMAADLITMLGQNHFTVINTARKYTPGADGATVTDLVLIAQKQ